MNPLLETEWICACLVQMKMQVVQPECKCKTLKLMAAASKRNSLPEKSYLGFIDLYRTIYKEKIDGINILADKQAMIVEAITNI